MAACGDSASDGAGGSGAGSQACTPVQSFGSATTYAPFSATGSVKLSKLIDLDGDGDLDLVFAREYVQDSYSDLQVGFLYADGEAPRFELETVRLETPFWGDLQHSRFYWHPSLPATIVAAPFDVFEGDEHVWFDVRSRTTKRERCSASAAYGVYSPSSSIDVDGDGRSDGVGRGVQGDPVLVSMGESGPCDFQTIPFAGTSVYYAIATLGPEFGTPQIVLRVADGSGFASISRGQGAPGGAVSVTSLGGGGTASLPSYAGVCQIGDIDADELPELVCVDDGVRAYDMDSSPWRTVVSEVDLANTAGDVDALVDVDCDGDLDVMMAGRYLENTGGGNFEMGHRFQGAYRGYSDFTGDGVPDLVYSTVAGEIVIVEGAQ